MREWSTWWVDTYHYESLSDELNRVTKEGWTVFHLSQGGRGWTIVAYRDV